MNEKNVPVWKINGLELKYDFDDLKAMERYEQAFHSMEMKSKEMPKDGNRSTQIKLYCQIMYELFDDLFGKGTSNKLFHGKMNARECDEVYESFLNFVHLNIVATDQARINKYQKYVGKKPADRKRKNKPYHA